jgi:hypothetical protein
MEDHSFRYGPTLCSLGLTVERSVVSTVSLPSCTDLFLPLRSSECFLATIVTIIFIAVREPMGVGAAVVGADWLVLDSMWLAPTG